MQNLKKNWLVVWKMTSEIWQIVTRTLWNGPNWDLDGILLPKVENAWSEFWILIRALKVSKICTLIGTFRSKYMTFDLRKYRGVIFRDTEVSCKIWRKNWLLVCKMIWEIWEILTWTSKTLPSKCQSWNFDAILLSKVENAWAKKLQRSYV